MIICLLYSIARHTHTHVINCLLFYNESHVCVRENEYKYHSPHVAGNKDTFKSYNICFHLNHICELMGKI
jgi:hypothetical protein